MSAVAADDLIGDGSPDLVIAATGGPTISVQANQTEYGATTTPVFNTTVPLTPGAGPSALALADFNVDGKLDIAVTNQSESDVRVFLNTTPAGKFSPSFAAQTDVNTSPLPV